MIMISISSGKSIIKFARCKRIRCSSLSLYGIAMILSCIFIFSEKYFKFVLELRANKKLNKNIKTFDILWKRITNTYECNYVLRKLENNTMQTNFCLGFLPT